MSDQQEVRAKKFLVRLGFVDLIHGEKEIKNGIHLTMVSGMDSNCADIVGFKPNKENANVVIACESKGTDVGHALVQLGNVAAALLDYFAAKGRTIELKLLVYRSSLRKLAVGNSPGPGYIVGDPDGSGLRRLLDATTDRTREASPKVDMKRVDARLTKWSDQVAKLPVYVYSEKIDPP